MKWCNCKESNSVPFEKMKRYNLTGNRHTAFLVTKCTECGKLVFFPHDNFELASKEGTDGTMHEIAQIIIKWIKS